MPSLLWQYTTGNTIALSPSVAYGKVFIGSMDGKLYALDAATGAKVWEFATGA
ncbi:MAG: PQQ-binding-like beta-propeller repeat protein, partial [Candidatus Bathyarchaeia archaeon]